MNLRQHLIDLYKFLSNKDELIRLLHYIPSDYSDNPLDVTKSDIVGADNQYDILSQVLIPSDKTVDLTTSVINRICMYPGTRKPQYNNYFSSNQDFIFDIYVHYSVDEIDQRLTWICDTLNDLLFNQKITGAGKIHFVAGFPITNAPTNWIGYKMVYKFIGLED